MFPATKKEVHTTYSAPKWYFCIYYSIMYVDCVQHRFVKFGTRKQLTEKVEKYKVEIYFTQRIVVEPLTVSGFTNPKKLSMQELRYWTYLINLLTNMAFNLQLNFYEQY